METIGSRILALRAKKKLSQKALGQLLGVSGVTVLKWEKDENIPKHESLELLSKKLDTTINYILYGHTETILNFKHHESPAVVSGIDQNGFGFVVFQI